MAQRMIHYLFSELLANKIEVKDKGRFLLGSLLPDAFSESFERDITHFKQKTDEYEYFDFNEFRNEYEELIKTDELYLGYYMHLVEDAFYRIFLFNGEFKVPCCKEDVEILHNDYHMLNNYIVRKYTVKNMLIEQKEFEKEPICKLAKFNIEELIYDLEQDFNEKSEEKTAFITEDMLDIFINEYIGVAEKEINAAKNGESFLCVSDYRWVINKDK